MRNLIISFALITSVSAQEIGQAAVESNQVAANYHWQNWAFAVSLIVTATLGVVFTSLHDGKSAEHDH